MIALAQIITAIERKLDMPPSFKKSRGTTVILDKQGRPKSPDKTPKTVKAAKKRKTARAVKAWTKASQR